MTRDNDRQAEATIWQGFHHAWEYNHRLNRLGSYVRMTPDPNEPNGERPPAVVGHTAASGTGGDTAHFAEYVTCVQADGVAFQAGEGETEIECMRGVMTPFRIRVEDLPLAPDLVGRERYTIILNGFDLTARRHSDKLIAFDLEITDPTIYADRAKARFNILGSMKFDCRTGECQLWPFGLEIEDVGRRKKKLEPPPDPGAPRPKRGIRRSAAIDKAVAWLKQQIATFTDLPNVKRWVLDNGENRLRRRLFRIFGKQIYLRLLKWRIATPYILRAHYVIIAGDADALRVTESDITQNSYTWDTEHEIHHEEIGVRPVSIRGADPAAYGCNTLAFKRITLETKLDEAFSHDNPIQWGQGMHLLEWSVALRDIRAAEGRITAQLDLFYKCWSEAMNEVITFTTWGALRSAGSAALGARLALLQFQSARACAQLRLPGHIHWPGGGRSAKEHPRACFERPVIPPNPPQQREETRDE
ncbi:MAG: hypothetical protein ACLFTI_05180 [Anaerolineales bacterium]